MTATVTTTMKPLPASPAPRDLLELSDSQSKGLLAEIWADSAKASALAEVPAVKSAAFKMRSKSNRPAVSSFQMEGADTVVAIPASAVQRFSEVAATVSVFSSDVAGRVVRADPLIEPLVVVNLDLYQPGAPVLNVSGLLDPIALTLPKVPRIEEAECAYWHEAKGLWASDGMARRMTTDGHLVCETRHLTLFAAILRGFLKAIQCSQLTLLTPEAMEALLDRDWTDSPLAIVFWLFLMGTFALFLLACRLDADRSQTWTDECFLIPMGELPPPPPKEKGGLMAKFCGKKKGESEAEKPKESAAVRAKKFIMEKVMLMSLQKQTSACLWLSDAVVGFITSSEELQQILHDAKSHRSKLAKETEGEKAWCELHHSIVDTMNVQRKNLGGLLSVPPVAARIFFQACPLVSVFLFCPFKSSSQRLLLLTCKFFGALTIGALFFQTTGEFADKHNPRECRPDGAGERIGRIIAVGIFSILLATLPVLLLSLLVTKKVQRIDNPDSAAWKKQLRKWRIQTAVLWVLGSLYTSFCIFFIALFLANIHPDDTFTWGTSGLTSLLKDEVVVPLFLAVAFPLFAVGTLISTSGMIGTEKLQLLQSRRDALKDTAISI